MVNTTLVKSFFIMPPGDIYILLRIEFLVAISTVLFLGMSVLDIFRGHFHSSIIKGMLSIVDGVSDSLVLYLMGAMQTAPFKNQLFPVWAIVLVSFRYSSDFITGYGIPDKQGRRFTEWRNVVKLLGVAFLNKTRGSKFAYPLWSLWCLQMVRGYYRLRSRNWAFESVWHGKSSEVVSEYMRTDTKFENFKLEDCKADTMEGYRYLVYGETDRHLLFEKPRYVLQIDSNPRETSDKARDKARAKRKAKANAKATTAQAQREDGIGLAKSQAKVTKAQTQRGLAKSQAKVTKAQTQREDNTEHAKSQATAIKAQAQAQREDNTERAKSQAKATKTQAREDNTEPAKSQAKATKSQAQKGDSTEPAKSQAKTTKAQAQGQREDSREPAKSQAKVTKAQAQAQKEDNTELAKSQAKATKAQAQREDSTGPAKSRAKALPDSLITLDKIWQCEGALLNPDSTHGDKFKDLSLAFSLSRLLRCRLEDVSLHKDIIPITKNLVLLRIIKEEANRAFGVMEMEMSFLNDYFNTRYPMVFWLGLNSLNLSLIMSAATFAAACWLSVDIRRVYKTPTDEVSHVIHGVNIDMVITWVFMFFMAFKEIWEMASYYLSDWARLLLASSYVRWEGHCLMRNRYMEKFISSFCTSKIASRKWHGVLDQFAFFQSYDDSPSAWNLIHTVSTGAIPKKDDGTKLSDHINIPECGKAAILATLRPMDLTRAHLPDVIPSLLDESRERYRWACFDLPTSTHIILVWHIATSLCEIRFADDRDINLGNPGFPLHTLLYLTSFCRCCCCAPQPYLVNENILDGDLKTRYIVANSLSRYCGYLLVSKPDLVPDSYLAPKMIFQETVKDARRILKKCDSLEEMYKELMDKVDTIAQDTSNSEENINIIQQGVKLAKQLMDEQEESRRWEILSGVWADLLIHIAPSWNAAAHKDCLDSGGEFITHIWALLWHCGIDKSMLWPVEGLPRNKVSGAPQNNNSENSSVQLTQDQQQAACEGERDDKLEMETADGASIVNGHGHLVRGMQNLGSTCYFNAVLQCLLALSELHIRIREQNSPEGLLLLELKKLFQEVAGGANSNGAGDTLVPEKLFSIMSSQYQCFKTDAMEDSNHLLGCLLYGLEKEEPTIVESLFRGQVAEHVFSKECEHSSLTTQDLVLCLAIPSKEHVSLEDCLDLYATGQVHGWHCTACSAATAPGNASPNPEDTAVDGDLTPQSDSVTPQMEGSSHSAEHRTSTPNQDKEKEPMLGEDAPQMEQSHTKHKEENKIYRTATVKFLITKAPPILTIQLKRFRFADAGRSVKLDEHVSFQEVLNITKFMEPRCEANDDCNYFLVAVIVHEGKELYAGHNYCYVRASSIGHESGVTQSWFCASDTNVRKVSLEEVLQCQAYILFYQRVDQTMVKTNLHSD